MPPTTLSAYNRVTLGLVRAQLFDQLAAMQERLVEPMLLQHGPSGRVDYVVLTTSHFHAAAHAIALECRLVTDAQFLRVTAAKPLEQLTATIDVDTLFRCDCPAVLFEIRAYLAQQLIGVSHKITEYWPVVLPAPSSALVSRLTWGGP